MDYFGDYFDPTYFDTADGEPEPTGGPSVGRRQRVAPPPVIPSDPDADEAYLGVI